MTADIKEQVYVNTICLF